MHLGLLGNRRGSWAAILLVLLLFVCFGYLRYRKEAGQDLASSFVGSRLLIERLPSHLFSHDPETFSDIGEDDTWTKVAEQGHYDGFLHPYVQTPLWAFLLEPLCRHLDYPAFARLFTALSMLCFAGCIWLTARYWAPSLFNPAAITIVVVALAFSQPFQYAMVLNQTHILLLLLTLVALVLAEQDRPWLAGLLLAFAAAVKITPGLLVVYWLLTRRWQAALSMVLWSGLLWGGTVLAVGHALTAEYLANLHRISRVLLLSQNNQSFAAWLMQHFYTKDEISDINILPLPTAVRLLSSFLMVAFTVAGGWIDRQWRGVAPLGAMVALIAATAFAPIAWTHYAIVLLIPLMILADRCRRFAPPWLAILTVAGAVLNYRPFASDVVHGTVGALALVRGQFFACMLILAALLSAAWLMHRGRGVPGLPAMARP